MTLDCVYTVILKLSQTKPVFRSVYLLTAQMRIGSACHLTCQHNYSPPEVAAGFRLRCQFAKSRPIFDAFPLGGAVTITAAK